MRKELVLFLFALIVGGLVFISSGPDGANRRARGSRGTVEAETPVNPALAFLPNDAVVWSRTLDNVFRAPRDTEPLEPIAIAAPPLPRLLHPGLPLPGEIGQKSRGNLRHEHPIDQSVPEATTSSVAVAAPPSGEGTEPSGEEEDPTEVVDIGALSPGERLRLTVEQELRLKALQKERERAAEDRRRDMDTLVYERGQRIYGRAEALNPEDDIHAIKLKIDAIRRDQGLNDDERRRELERLSFVFREDRGVDKAPGRVTVRGSIVQTLEFANTPVNRFRLGMLQAGKDDVALRLDLVRAVLNAGERELAVQELQKLHASGERSPQSTVLLADASERALDYEGEIRAVEEGLATWPNDLDLLARKGRFSLRIGLAAAAETAFQKVIAERSQDPVARLGLGRAALADGRPAEAREHLKIARDAVGIAPEDRRNVLVLLGQAALAEGEFTSASQAFASLLDQNPSDPDALIGQLMIALTTKGPEAAEAAADAALAAHPLNGRINYLNAIIKLRLAKWDAALPLLDLVPELDPFLSAHTRLARSWLAEKTGRFEGALALAESALVADPTNLEAKRQRARANFLVGDLPSAEEGYLEVIAQNPDDVDSLVALGDTAASRGEIEEARRWYDRVLKLAPDYPDLFVRRYMAAVRAADVQAANRMRSEISARMERDPKLQVAMAYHYYAMESNPEECLQRYNTILNKEDASPPLRSYVETCKALITDNLSKERWRDDFERTGQQIGKDWKREVGAGVNIALSGGRLAFQGAQRKASMEATVAYQERPGRSFYSFEVDLEMTATPGVYSGIGLLGFQRATATEPYDGLQRREEGGGLGAIAYYGGQVALAPEGRLRFRVLDKGVMTEWEDLPVTIDEGPIRLGFEMGNKTAQEVHVLVNRRRAATLTMPGIGRWQRMLELQVFTQAANGREIKGFSADNVEIVSSKQ